MTFCLLLFFTTKAFIDYSLNIYNVSDETASSALWRPETDMASGVEGRSFRGALLQQCSLRAQSQAAAAPPTSQT